ncbi:single-stranded-DNA-specific exonuclease RecJ [Synoicihabitans lomoniglobus]|uniref:Single-stranded-DNA-specific exonuclease RecJ n=1 Tax=Synoicihabitans lomoniglobus TaxID=2909285 RepID=A0AAF0I7H7_9BACT|nr:single-stranded-DNA-specific exonuclease RecJ [Opitutaceae bacterium LMO-M01]WED66751.1 single-stranded-DNA-specific exonuclease RecJ [Opitutaceae bacterium LMO-M01]
MRWTYTPPPADEVGALSRSAGVSPVLAELLWRRDILSDEAAQSFLRPALAELGDPFLLANLEAATARLSTAISNRESVAVLGDYDVDGVSSTTLMVSLLRRFGLDPHFVVPRRMEDGYGLSRSAIDRALEGVTPQLFIVLDCGTNSQEEVAYLQEKGIDVIIIDHHREKEGAVASALLINPHVHPGDDDDAWRHLCTVGLVFKLAHGLLKRLRNENHPVAFRIKLREYLDLVAMGTVADLVPLRGENRLMARHGLRVLQGANRPGVRALMQVAGVRPEQGVNPVDISFRLGPRINASGRLADAALSVELMLSDDTKFCIKTADQLDVFNRERQDIERQITKEAEEMIEQHYADDSGIVLYSDDWHPGVVGIVAGRVSRKYNRPCVVLGNEGELAKGSGRSVDGINLVEVLAHCDDFLGSWGGHPMAVGVAAPKASLEQFRRSFSKAVAEHTGGDLPERELPISAWITPDEIGSRLMEELDALHPFGQANAEPVFGLRGVKLSHRPDVFKALHFRFNFEDTRGRRLFGVAWKMANRLPPTRVPLDFAVHLRWNHFNDRKLMQLELVDWRPAGEANGS